jgi:anti-sigma regulatory factor (Ser/Thr protein kinase)
MPYMALIVDSRPEINRLLASLFDPSEWNIRFVPDNKSAVDAVEAEPFDIIITGECTSGQEDISLLRRLRMVRPHSRLIILTDKFTPGDVLDSIRERAFSYFTLPLSTERFAELVRSAMAEPSWDDGIELLSATPNWTRFSVRCDVLTANRLLQFYREASQLPDAETEEVATAFREILLNAMEHGGHFDPSQFVEVSYVRTQHAVICKVKDPGEGFALDELKHAAVSNPPEDPFRHVAQRDAMGMRPGGFGILMAKRLVDELLFNEKGNEVLLIKYLHPPETEATTATPTP